MDSASEAREKEEGAIMEAVGRVSRDKSSQSFNIFFSLLKYSLNALKYTIHWMRHCKTHTHTHTHTHTQFLCIVQSFLNE